MSGYTEISLVILNLCYLFRTIYHFKATKLLLQSVFVSRFSLNFLRFLPTTQPKGGVETDRSYWFSTEGNSPICYLLTDTSKVHCCAQNIGEKSWFHFSHNRKETTQTWWSQEKQTFRSQLRRFEQILVLWDDCLQAHDVVGNDIWCLHFGRTSLEVSHNLHVITNKLEFIAPLVAQRLSQFKVKLSNQ